MPLHSRPGRRVLAVSIAVGLALTGCTRSISGQGQAVAAGSPTPATPTRPSTSPAPSSTVRPTQFVDCNTQLVLPKVSLPAAIAHKITFTCAQLAVPLDYSDPTGITISLQLIKIHDSDDTHGLGSLLVNPGGPGASGLQTPLELLTEISPKVLQHFDLIGFDPRGVGLSTPISCVSDSDKDVLNAASPDIATAAGFREAKAIARQFAAACESKYGTALDDFDTVNTARDMDRIRAAVGDPKLNYLGFSYGTELGSVYAHLFPQNIRVAVLDGAVDPLTSGINQSADQLAGFEGAFDQFAADCLKHSPCDSLGDPRHAVYDIFGNAEKQPLNTSSGRKLTAGLASTGVLGALYSHSLWTTLGNGLIAAKKGDGTILLALADSYNRRRADGSYSNILDAFTTISCDDQAAGPTDSTIRATARSWATHFPMFGRWFASGLFTCQQWQPRRTVPPKPIAATPTKVLVIGNLHDPATPYQGAKDLTTTMGNAELLSWDGEGHTSYLEGSACVDNYVNQYLISQTLPPEGTTCPR